MFVIILTICTIGVLCFIDTLEVSGNKTDLTQDHEGVKIAKGIVVIVPILLAFITLMPVVAIATPLAVIGKVLVTGLVLKPSYKSN